MVRGRIITIKGEIMKAREKLNLLAKLIRENQTKYLTASITLFGSKSIMSQAKEITSDISSISEAIHVLAKRDALAVINNN